MANYSINQPSAYFQAQLYTGNSSTQTVTNGGPANLQPDVVWTKCRSNTSDNFLFDSIRGVQNQLHPNTTDPQGANATSLTSFNSDGWTMGNTGGMNFSSQTYVGWQWKCNAGTSPSNTQGQRTSLVQSNSTAGFNIIQFNDGGSTGQTVGHGLGEVPSFFLAKNKNSSSGWYGMFPKIWGGNQSSGINTTNAFGTVSGFSNFTSTLFTSGQSSSSDHICYAWKPIRGYSAFGTYKSNNNADGPKIFTGFRPALVLCKMTSGGTNWRMYDSRREGFNPENNYLLTNSTAVENTAANAELEIHSNGFKLTNAEGDINYNSENVLYAAWAELPQVFTDGVPVQAR